MSPAIYILTISLLPLTAIVVFAMKYASAYAAAKARASEDVALKSAIQQAATAHAATSASLEKIERELSRLSASVASVETMIRQVG